MKSNHLDVIRKLRHKMSEADARNETIRLWNAEADREALLFYVDQLREVVAAADALCDVIDDRVHDHLKANERHWVDAYRDARAKLEKP